jgi:hypothetical protein
MAVIHNRPGGTVVVHLVANADLKISGNSSVSNVAYSNSSYREVVHGASIRRVVSGAEPDAYWKISRGSNTVIVGQHLNVDLKEGWPMGLFPAANLTVTLEGGTNGFIMIELSKDLGLE